MVLQRERLHAVLDARLPGAVWLHGPTGAGKTVLLRSHLHRERRVAVWVTVDERHRDPAALFAAIGAAAASICDGPLQTQLPVFSPEHRDDPATFANDYFSRLHQALPVDAAFVVDDVHHLVGWTAPLLAYAIDAFDGRRSLCFASQLMPDAGFAPQVAGSRLWIVGHRSLAFDGEEARELASRLGASTSTSGALVGATDGWAAGLMLAMQFGAGGGANDGSDDPLAAVRTPLALLIAGQVLGGVGHDELARLRLLAELPQIPMELADAGPGWAAACSRLQALSERGLFVERLVPADPPAVDRVAPASNVRLLRHGCWRLHDLFRNALGASTPIAAADVAIGRELTGHLLAVDRVDLAWQLAARLGTDALEALAASHGGVALRSAHLPMLLQTASPHAGRDAPTVAVWLARGLVGQDHAAALRACHEAHAGFTARGDAAGVALTVALALFIVFGTIENVGEVAVWAARFAPVPRADAAANDESDEHAIRIAGEVVHDLLIGGRSVDAAAQVALQDRLMRIVVAEILSANETIIAGALLVSAMCRAMRVGDVELAVIRVEALTSYRRAAPHIRANWKIENGYHFTRLGNPDEAMRCLDDAVVVADENTLLQPRIGALIALVRLELGVGDVRRAQARLASLDEIGQERLGRLRGWVLHLKARAEALIGRPAAALAMLDRAETLIVEAGFPDSAKAILDQDRIQMLYASGAVDDSLALARSRIAAGSPADARRLGVLGGLLEAHAMWDDDRPGAIERLERHLASAAALDLTTFVYLLPHVASQIAGRALQRGIAVDFVQRAVRVRNLPAPVDAPADWPWPVRIEVLRPFRIVRHGEPLAFSGKAQQKPLELLKFLACHRDLVADAGAIAGALWPDADEGAGKKSLEVTVSRLRKLLDDDGLVIVKEGKVALDRRRIASDAVEFLQAAREAEAVVDGRHRLADVVSLGDRLLHTFVELPLEHEEPTPWREALRERYKATFVRAVRALIAYWDRAGDAARAVTLIEAALVREPLAEGLYRLLMQIHLDAKRHTDAMRVYRQCRQMLSVLIGAAPAAETERLKSLIHL